MRALLRRRAPPRHRGHRLAADRCTPPTQALELHSALLEHGVLSELVIYPQEGHGVRAFPAQIDQATRVIDFLTEHV